MIVVSDEEHSNVLFRVFEDLYDMSIPRIKEEPTEWRRTIP
jgi:hypothetical protein